MDTRLTPLRNLLDDPARAGLFAALFATAIAAAGCSGGGDSSTDAGGGTPPNSQLTVAGVVSQESTLLPPTPSAGVEVKMTSDLNPAGVSIRTDATGHYQLAMNVTLGERVVVAARAATMAPGLEVINAGPNAKLELNLLLRPLAALTCTAQQCGTADSGVTISGLPAGVTGVARAFSPVAEKSAFPGPFFDSTGNLLISAAFSNVQLQDAAGRPLTSLAAPADLCMRVPRDTWNIIVDTQPGTDRIEVPLFSFDEAKGQWMLDGKGFLKSDSGAMLGESQLASVRDGSFTEGLVACGKVSHFSAWNVDFSRGGMTCLAGDVTDENDKPAEGAVVLVDGVTYNGRSEAQTVGKDGKFCQKVLRSEAPTEDLDQNGVTGQTHQAKLTIAYAGSTYDGPKVDTPKDPHQCGDCAHLGILKLTKALLLAPKVCTINGMVVDLKGQAVAGASIFGQDPTVSPDALGPLCAPNMTGCAFAAQSSITGAFTLKLPMVRGASLVAAKLGVASARTGKLALDVCPTSLVTVKLTDGQDSLLNVAVSADTSNGQIAWTPALAAQRIEVVAADGSPKWTVESATGIATPVTYGTVPPGAEQLWPLTGSPDALVSGDRITVTMNGTGADGYPYRGAGSTTVP